MSKFFAFAALLAALVMPTFAAPSPIRFTGPGPQCASHSDCEPLGSKCCRTVEGFR
ncbi:hypothetical protein FA13DRAFT_1787177 [Coprinellus micaceus]|uniref:WAP domain-containing protein n=1 Tax=Coprinellus micaceus TaxID=71717 RepID=A0A4Y7TSE5_COPMI|nr:hypothetical protein FA13DRAFT_1787177 [Coprinellus micaceus]